MCRDLSNNAFTEVPSVLTQLTNLKELFDLSQNKDACMVTSFPVSSGSVIDGNPFAEFPEELCDYSGMKHLVLDNMALTELPACVTELVSLTYLFVPSRLVLACESVLIGDHGGRFAGA